MPLRKEIVISHNVQPPTILEITKWGYHLKFGNYSIPFGKDEGERLAELIFKDLNKETKP